MLNKSLFELAVNSPFIGITDDEVLMYAEEVKGDYLETAYEGELCPPALISIMEYALYNLDGLDITEDNDYFDTLRALGSDDFQVTLEELYALVPELREQGIADRYEGYQYFNDLMDCVDIFHMNLTTGEENYLFVYHSGGSYGAMYVVLKQLVDGELVEIGDFMTQNNGYGRVIAYEEEYYYVFLQYNYNLKNYDGVRIHKLGEYADRDNILIRYVPDRYFWKNVYRSRKSGELEIARYVDSIKAVVAAAPYIEAGDVTGVSDFSGDEQQEKELKFSDGHGADYYKIDFANIGTPVYFYRFSFEPSNYRTAWQLRARFYMYDTQEELAIELEKMALTELSLPLEIKLMQLWFKELEGKVFTFRMYHIFNYNYLLNVSLVEGDTVTQVRNDMISPQRHFVLTEGEVFGQYG